MDDRRNVARQNVISWLCHVHLIPDNRLKRSFKRCTIVVAVCSVILALITLGFCVAEMVKVNAYHDRLSYYLSTDEPTIFTDRDGNQIEAESLPYFLEIYGYERAIITIMACIQIMGVVSSFGLLRAGFSGMKQYALPWIGHLLVNFMFGSIAIILDVMVYSLHQENLAEVIFWVIALLIQGTNFRAVTSYVNRLPKERNQRMHSGVAVFDPRDNNAIFVIGGSSTPTGAPFHLMLTPPTYTEAMADDDYIKPPSICSDDDIEQTPTDDPPDYEP